METTVKITSETTSFKTNGLVYGKFWGGGEGSYQARKIEGYSKEYIIEQAEKGLDGSLDAGMGYESLLGAILDITKTTTVMIDGKSFENEETETVFVGKLTDKQKEFLEDQMMYI